MTTGKTFTIIGENIHCTRKVKLGGKRTTTLPDGRQAIVFEDDRGVRGTLPVSEALAKAAGPAGLVAHVRCAVELALAGNDADRRLAVAYIHWMARRQLDAGAHFLDVNVDEISGGIEAQNAAMRWVVPVVQAVSNRPVSIDSSSLDILRVGLEACDPKRGGRPMLNSVSLERPEVADLAARYQCHVVALPVSESGMPCGVDDRLANIDSLVALLTARGLPHEDIYVDPLILAASTDPTAPQTVLETIRQVRAKYPKIHIAGGHSNISHGLPMRRLLNAVWLVLATEAGVDSGIIDPLAVRPADFDRLDRSGESFRMAEAGLMARDEFFIDFITAAREGKLVEPWAD
jgi:5-methyltetrahydrofolate corrinoid/iron sulfur protein methyltransferase